MRSSIWNIRMRASKLAVKSRALSAENCPPIPGPQPTTPEIHISGAEGICSGGKIKKRVQAYIDRAITHPRGRPDSIVITIEELKQPLLSLSTLPLTTVKCSSSARAEAVIVRLLAGTGVSVKAIASALSILKQGKSMRGACLLRASSGRRVEPDQRRGIRASRFGIAGSADRALSAELDRIGINTETVREALVLASKVASCTDVLAELCISDDPDYTTGYVASKDLGYVRIPHIKKKHDRRGGRIFFLREHADIRAVIQFLEKTPAIIKRIRPCAGEKTADEILDRSHK